MTRAKKKARTKPLVDERGAAKKDGGVSQPISRKRRWLFRSAGILLIPVIVFVLTETTLHLVGFGHPVSFLLPAKYRGRTAFVQNDRFAWRFFGPEMARQPAPLLMQEPKPTGTIRIFVFGESAAMGDPQPEFGLPRMVEALLSARFPGTRFEVINAAMTAINSHVILPIARECAAREGDIWVLYIGNNEVVGPYGAGTIFGPRAPSRALVRWSLAARGTRIGQWIESLERSLRKRAPSEMEWGGMQMFIRNQVRADAPGMRTVYDNFARNLADIIEAGRRSQAKVLVSTVASNLKDCAPFASLHRPDLSEAALGEWEALYRQAQTAQQTSQFAEAVEFCRQAEKIDGSFAELHFLWGQCCLAVGQEAEARGRLTLSRDLDALRFRCDSRLNEIIRRTTFDREQEGILFADPVAAMAQHSPHGLTGREFFYEHVHLTFEGNYLLAVTLAEQLIRLLPAAVADKAVSAQWPSASACAQRLAWADWNRYEGTSSMLGRVLDPPFTFQLDHAIQQEALRHQLEQLLPGIQPAALRHAESNCRAVLALWPDDWLLHQNLARILQKLGDFRGAAESWSCVVDLLRHNGEAWQELGATLAQQNRDSEGSAAFQQALRLDPASVASHSGVAQILARQGRNEQALREFEVALKLKPYWGPAHLALGQLLEKMGRSTEAQPHFEAALQTRMKTRASFKALGQFCFEKGWFPQAATNFMDALRLDPADAVTHVNLGMTLESLGQHIQAQSHYAEAVRLDPDLAEAHARLGLELGRQGNDAGAVEQFAEAVRLKPELLEARLNLGIALLKQRRSDEARDQFQEVLRRSPTNAVAIKYLESLKAP